MRSSWKLLPLEASSTRYAFIPKLSSNVDLKTWAKGTKIFSDLLEKKLQIYNGVKFIELAAKREMLGASLGGFVLTKRITADIHNKTKKNKKGRLNKHKKK